MAESRITKYDKEAGTVEWFYHAHEDGKRHDVVDNVQEFIKKLILHIPDKLFRTVNYYGFYSNKAQKTLDRAHELPGKKKKMNGLKYRTHMIDSFNRDPIKCSCGHTLKYKYTYDPLKGISNDRKYRNKCINEMYKMQIPGKRARMGP